MLKDVIKAVKGSDISKIVVSANDPQVSQVARELDVSFFSPSQDGLNPAIEEATNRCFKDGADSVVVLPADLPLLRSEEVNRVISFGNTKSTSIVICPSWDWGTNALLLKVPKVILPRFGPNSFIEHICQALSNGISVMLYSSLGISTDIDCARDLRKLFEIENHTECKRVLEIISKNNLKAKKIATFKL
jgi:2-phospho-L-lactate guanylyltransferase